MNDWTEVDGALEKTFTFANFVEAMTFVNRVADAAEAAGHHPDIAISWNRVTLRVSTHDAGTITEKDRSLVATIEALVDPAAGAPVDIDLLESQRQRPRLQMPEMVEADLTRKTYTISGKDEEADPRNPRAVPPGESM
jgi:4a-hydroxytetrahydrobiopterin dehydratase